MSIPSSLGLGVVKGLRETDEQSDCVGLVGVGVKEGVNVGVRLGVGVSEETGAAVLVGRRVLVGVNGIGTLDGVHEGRTKLVLAGGTVADGVGVKVWVGMSVGVEVICSWICPCASVSEMGTISLWEQNCPVMVQDILSSSGVSGWGIEGSLIDWLPFAPPNRVLTFCPAPKYCS
jgi:hypothetical protein